MIRLLRDLAVLAAAVVLAATAPARADITGRASVIDGDTIEIRGQRIRLFGLDAPEGSQLCAVNDEQYRCGQKSALALADKIGERTVRCEERDIDRYKRIVAVCYVGSEDINGWLVKQGWAVAFRKYSHDYVGAEEEAKKAGRGLWRGEFEPPWEWRSAHRRR